VTDLFTALLDLDVTPSWTWQNVSPEEAAKRLDYYMTIRGNIAHRTRHGGAVEKKTAKAFLSHVANLVEKTDIAIESHLRSLIGGAPW
jgi:class 3 adenylate cyclase